MNKKYKKQKIPAAVRNTVWLKWVTDKNNIPNSKLYENLIENENIKNYVQHSFSHFKLILNIYEIRIRCKIDIEGEWINLDDALRQLPSLMKKVANII